MIFLKAILALFFVILTSLLIISLFDYIFRKTRSFVRERRQKRELKKAIKQIRENLEDEIIKIEFFDMMNEAIDSIEKEKELVVPKKTNKKPSKKITKKTKKIKK